MKLSLASPECWLKVEGLWNDVTLTVFGIYLDGPNERAEKLNEFTRESFSRGAAQLKKIPVVPAGGTPTKFKYFKLLFVITTFPNNTGNVHFDILASKEGTSQPISVATPFDLKRQVGDPLRLEHPEDLEIWQ